MTFIDTIHQEIMQNESSAKVDPGRTDGRTAERFIIVNM